MWRPQTGWGRIAFTAALCLGAGLVVRHTLELGPVARLAPIWVAVPTAGLLVLQLVLDLRPAWATRLERLAFRPRPRPVPEPAEAAGVPPAAGDRRRPRREVLALGALLGLAGLALAVGVVLAVPLFLLGYLIVGSGLAWWRAGLIALGAFVVLFIGFPNVLGIELPPGRLLDLRSPVWL